MKKLKPIFLIGVLLISFLIPFGSAFAYSGGLLDGKPLNLGKSINDTMSTTMLLTDSIHNSGQAIYGKDDSTRPDVVWYKFSEEKTLKSFQLSATNLALKLFFYDSNGLVVYSEDISTVNGTRINLDDEVSNVRYVSLETTKVNQAVHINSFDVFQEFLIDYSGGLLDGVSSDSLNVSSITDNNYSTEHSLLYGEDLYYTFNETVNISKIKTLAKTSDLNSFTVSFFNDSSDLIVFKRINLTNSFEDHTLDFDVSGVKKIKINVYARPDLQGSVDIKEFNVYPNAVNYDELLNLSLIPSHNEVTLHWSIPSDNPNFTGSKIYRNGVLIDSVDKETNVYIDSNEVNPNTSYTYKVTAVYLDGTETNGISLATTTHKEPVDESKIPPSNVTDLIAIDITGTSAKLSWVNSSDEDLESINIYNSDQSLITTIPVTNEYLISNLNPDTTYNFYVALVDKDGNISGKTPISFTTLMEEDSIAPVAPKGLTVDSGSSALYVSWDKNLESDIQGYNIYVDGVKNNSVIVKNNFYSVPNLENDLEYTISVTAVDKSGNESVFSNGVSGMPLSSEMPIIGMDYSLTDVAIGIEKWFSSQWLILAFAISIPLSFYIASRIKLMFLD